MVRHYGVFKFKPEITEAQIDECFKAMKAMMEKVLGLQDMEHGPYQSDKVIVFDFVV